MDEVRRLAMQMALEFTSHIDPYDADKLFKIACRIEAYLRGQDAPSTAAARGPNSLIPAYADGFVPASRSRSNGLWKDRDLKRRRAPL